jgi:hypothetical protein
MLWQDDGRWQEAAQNPDDLLFRKAVALHALVLVVGQNERQTGLSP